MGPNRSDPFFGLNRSEYLLEIASKNRAIFGFGENEEKGSKMAGKYQQIRKYWLDTAQLHLICCLISARKRDFSIFSPSAKLPPKKITMEPTPPAAPTDVPEAPPTLKDGAPEPRVAESRAPGQEGEKPGEEGPAQPLKKKRKKAYAEAQMEIIRNAHEVGKLGYRSIAKKYGQVGITESGVSLTV